MDLKKSVIVGIILLIPLIFVNKIAYSEENENFKPRVSINLTCGPGYLSLGELNEYLNTESLIARRAEKYYDEFSLTDEIKQIHYGIDFEGELRITLSSRFAIGLSAGYIHAENEGYHIMRGENIGVRTVTIRESYNPKIIVLPVKLGIYYRQPLFRRTALLFTLGGGYYFVKIRYNHDQHSETHLWNGSDSTYWVESPYEVKGGNFGYHVGIGFEFRVTKNVFLIIEGQYRFIKIKELTGKNIMTNSEGNNKKVYGTLWYHFWESEGEYLTYLFISDIRPDPSVLPDIRRMSIFDLTGFSIRAGIRICLF